MKKGWLLVVMMILFGCQSSGTLKEEQYEKTSLKRYEEIESLDEYDGTLFDAKLVLMDRYINEEEELFYEYRVFVKPLVELQGKDIAIQIVPDALQEGYYSAQTNQRLFQEMYYPIEKNAKQYECIEFAYRLGSFGFDEVSQEKWQQSMEHISVLISNGANQETIKFHKEIDNTYTKNETNTTGIDYYGSIRKMK